MWVSERAKLHRLEKMTFKKDSIGKVSASLSWWKPAYIKTEQQVNGKSPMVWWIVTDGEIVRSVVILCGKIDFSIGYGWIQVN